MVSYFQKSFWVKVVVAVILSAAIAIGSAHAATSIASIDFLSSEAAGQNADHYLLFGLPSGVAEGNSLTIDFESGFDTSAITEDDIDIEDDSIELTTAPDCTGTEEVGISIASNVITFEICTGDGGAIGASSVMTVEIGLNATASGTGSSQIVNPALDGSYFVSIGGTAGDGGSIVIPISSSSDKSVTATVPDGGSGDDGGGGDGGDSTPPSICCVVVSNITETSADISWNTDENADSRVNYGLTSSYGAGFESNSSLVVNHSISLTGLTPGTEYHFQVVSSDNDANTATSGDYTFETLDSTAPVISNVQVVDITETSARVTWNTNEPATSLVDFGQSAGYGSQVSDGAFVTSHSLILTGLTHSTMYHFMVTSEDAASNSTSSSDDTFTTLTNPPPGNVSNLSVVEGDTRLTFTWTNPTDDDLAGIRFLCSTTGYPTTPNTGVLVVDALVEEALYTGLTNDITQYCTAFAYDDIGQFSSGAIISGTPMAPVVELPTEEEPPTEELPPEPGEELPDGGEEPIEVPPEAGEDYFCGDGTCSPAETFETCPLDCPVIEEVPSCGNAICEQGESSDSCSSDCPVVEIPPEEVTEGGQFSAKDVQFFVAELQIELFASDTGKVDMLGNRDLRVQLNPSYLHKTVNEVRLVIGDQAYLMAQSFPTNDSESGIYTADVTSPAQPLGHAMTLTILYEDGTSQTLSFTANVLPDGYAYETLESGGTATVGNTTVTLFALQEGDFNVIDLSSFGESNPLITGSDGKFAWYVRDGLYYIEVEKSGYETLVSQDYAVGNSILNPVVVMTPIPVEEEPIVEQPPEKPITPEVVPFTSRIAETIENAARNVEIAIKALRELPGVQETATVATPIITAAMLASGITLAISFNLIPFLQYLITAPILFFWRRKRKGFGIVYNAMTKVGVDLAIVRLYDFKTKKLVRSRVTDREGRYFFLVNAGKYRLQVKKPGFHFPTEYLASVKADGMYLDVYHGEEIKVDKNNVAVTANIPLDPVDIDAQKAPARVRREKILRKVQYFVAVFGVLLAIFVVIIQPSISTVIVALGQIVMFFLIRRLVVPRKPKSWGIVYDKSTGRPIANTIVRLFEPKYKKLLETRLTDAKGRYSFLLGPSEYFATFDKIGYASKEVSPIDFSAKKEVAELSIDIKLVPNGESDKTSQGTSERS